MTEESYASGMRRALINMLQYCMKGLGVEDPWTQQARWVKERAELVEQLREVCTDWGDNDWADDLYLPDVIEKHLARQLHVTTLVARLDMSMPETCDECPVRTFCATTRDRPDDMNPAECPLLKVFMKVDA